VAKTNDRRDKQAPVPDKLERFLNSLQISTIYYLEAIGWKLWFVRRPLFQPGMPVLLSPTGRATGIVEENGSLSTSHGLEFRPD
jgi:hypothetical protein